jgi:hypothetical protein
MLGARGFFVAKYRLGRTYLRTRCGCKRDICSVCHRAASKRQELGYGCRSPYSGNVFKILSGIAYNSLRGHLALRAVRVYGLENLPGIRIDTDISGVRGCRGRAVGVITIGTLYIIKLRFTCCHNLTSVLNEVTG